MIADISELMYNIPSSLPDLPQEEPARQFYYMEQCSAVVADLARQCGRPLTYHIETFGCQMNFKDSEKLAGVLEKIGFVEKEDENADFVLYNTCTVRENANQRVYGRIGYLGKLKKTKNPNMVIAMCGCMMQEAEPVENIKKSYRFVDLIFGTHNIYKLAELLFTVYSNRGEVKPGTRKTKASMVIDIWKDTDRIVEELPSKLKAPFKAGVNIMFGCNNFCSYCIVPYVRGRERSREPEDIIKEIKKFVSEGVIEVMLLGQNVNSYGKNLQNPVSFARLLQMIEKIDGLERIRFMTSHPKDLSDELIEVMKNSPKICHHIHLPVQSGSTRLLKIMNRRYTKEDYLKLIEKIRAAIPDIAITTDIIVGFPGETEEDFLETLDVCRRVCYDSAFTFIYSKRTGTPAASFDDQVPEDVIKERFDRLLKVVAECSAQKAGTLSGETKTVLVEELDREGSKGCRAGHVMLTGRLDNNLLVHFEGDPELVGKLVRVKLTECKDFYYFGEMED